MRSGVRRRSRAWPGGRHVDQYAARTPAHQVEHAEHRQYFVHARRNALEKLRKKLAFEPEIHVHARHFRSGGLRRSSPSHGGPTPGIRRQHPFPRRGISDLPERDGADPKCHSGRCRPKKAPGQPNKYQRRAPERSRVLNPSAAEIVVFPTPPLPKTIERDRSIIGQSTR